MKKYLLRPLFRAIMKKASSETRVKIGYFRSYNKWPNIKNPRTFNEKVLQRMVYDKNPRYAELADKYAVRKYISEKIGEEYLIPLLYVTCDPETLLKLKDWSHTVIKPNHAAGLVMLFDEDPDIKEKERVVAKTKEWLKLDFSNVADEWHYSMIEPLVLVERKITPENVIPRDYKFHCFRQNNGDIKYVMQVVDGRFGTVSKGYYLNSLDQCVWHHGDGCHHLTEDEKSKLSEVLVLHDLIMGKEFKYLRIDWYLIEGKIYFGELTFTSGAGRINGFGANLEKQMAEWWLPE
ncbi:hypothetical protein PMPD1_2142 [Paramixta manurensis]|uniref:Uncharacterized protein n=1 Tax=Paramixta manurensis TaxID=2740817 RepID=A0A6M8U8Q2_9GAMM|nr:hypothetical protein PMPD1_2142 [Erwiniaceae bacterium PD-1]